MCAGRPSFCTSQGSTTSTSFLKCSLAKPEQGWRRQLGLGEQSLWDRMEGHRMGDSSPGPLCCLGCAKPWSGLFLSGNDLLLLMKWQKLMSSWNTASSAQTNALRPCITQLSIWLSEGCSTGSTSQPKVIRGSLRKQLKDLSILFSEIQVTSPFFCSQGTLWKAEILQGLNVTCKRRH